MALKRIKDLPQSHSTAFSRTLILVLDILIVFDDRRSSFKSVWLVFVSWERLGLSGKWWWGEGRQGD